MLRASRNDRPGDQMLEQVASHGRKQETKPLHTSLGQSRAASIGLLHSKEATVDTIVSRSERLNLPRAIMQKLMCKHFRVASQMDPRWTSSASRLDQPAAASQPALFVFPSPQGPSAAAPTDSSKASLPLIELSYDLLRKRANRHEVKPRKR